MVKISTYKQAYDELVEIANSLDKNEVEIDLLAKKIKRATELVHFCKEKLRNIEKEIDLETKNK